MQLLEMNYEVSAAIEAGNARIQGWIDAEMENKIPYYALRMWITDLVRRKKQRGKLKVPALLRTFSNLATHVRLTENTLHEVEQGSKRKLSRMLIENIHA